MKPELYLPIEIDGSSEISFKSGAIKLLEKIRPKWQEVTFKIYTDGITNKLIGAWNQSNKNDQVLIRIYGENTDLFIDRKSELENLKILYAHDMGPELYATFENGISYGFLNGLPLNIDYIRKENIWKMVAEEMAKLHKIKVNSTNPCLFTKVRKFISLLPENFTTEQRQRLDDAGLNKSYIEKETDFLEKHLKLNDCAIVFSHNDILPANIVWNEENETVKFIDYEYGAPNYQPFDIANHFNEFAGLGEADYALYPDTEFQKKWIHHYLCHFLDQKEVDDARVNCMVDLVEEFCLASHVFWGTWALLQDCNSTIDFDFMGYAICRFNEYKRKKPHVFKLQTDK